MAFADLKDDMDLAEDFLKYLVAYALAHCQASDHINLSMNNATNQPQPRPSAAVNPPYNWQTSSKVPELDDAV